MPNRFLKSDHRETLSNFPTTIDDQDVITHFLLTPDDLAIVTLKNWGRALSMSTAVCTTYCRENSINTVFIDEGALVFPKAPQTQTSTNQLYAVDRFHLHPYRPDQ